MDIQTMTTFFMWCTIINGSLFLFWTIAIRLAPDLVYRTQNKFLPMPKETFNVVMYSFLGLFKIVFLFFNIVPYLTLLLMA